MDQNTTNILNSLAPAALAELKNYFETAADDKSGQKADMALKLLGRINGNDSNRLKEVALQIQLARQAGIKGEPLRPILAALNPAFEPKKIEQSSNQ